MIFLVTENLELSHEDFTIISVEKSLEILEKEKILGFDTETTGLNPVFNEILTLQFGNSDFQVVIDCTTVDVLNYKNLLESKNHVFLGWNLKFDCKFLYKYGIILRQLYDGMIVEQILKLGYDRKDYSLSLKSALLHYLNIEADKSIREDIVKLKSLNHDILIYAAKDVEHLHGILEKQTEILKSRGQIHAARLENKIVPVTAYFEHCGVKLDIPKWKSKMKKDQIKFRKCWDELDDFIINYYLQNKSVKKGYIRRWWDFGENGTDNPKHFKFEVVKDRSQEKDYESSKPNVSHNFVRLIDIPFGYFEQDMFSTHPSGLVSRISWKSSKQVVGVFKILGFNTLTKDKKTGEYKDSVEAPIIAGQLHVSPIAKIYLKFKAAQKVIDNYGQSFLDCINRITGRIHTQFNQLGTDTHRFSSGGGSDDELIPGKTVKLLNLQNLPANAETRSCFIAEKGNRWISIDYSGQESVILANISKDKEMINIYLNGCGDLHSLVAKMIYTEELKDVPVEDIKKVRPDLRKKAKGPEFKKKDSLYRNI